VMKTKGAIEFYKEHGFEERDRFNYWVRMTKQLEDEDSG
jgi:ribosomal protein S18 acetylase RimI-like enzyme